MKLENKIFAYLAKNAGWAALLSAVVFAAYQHQPAFTLRFGSGLDRMYFTNAHPLQTVINGKSYRRIRDVSIFTLQHTGHGLRYRFTLRAVSSEPESEPLTFPVYVNKRKVSETKVSNRGAVIAFNFTEGKIKVPFLFFQFVNEGERLNPPKGLFLESLKVEPEKTGTFVLPPAKLIFALIISMWFLYAAAFLCSRKTAFWFSLISILAIGYIFFFKRRLFLPFADALPVLTLGTLLFMVLIRLLIPPLLKRLNLNPVLSCYTALLIVLLTGFLLRVVICFYPGAIISDIDFHAHRMGALYKHGEIFQVSATPDEKYLFPYPTLLYLLSAPVKFATGLPNGIILRWSIVLFDSLTALLIFLLGLKVTRNCTAAVFAAGFYTLLPLSIYKFQYGNCTEIFSLFIMWLFLTALVYQYKHLRKIWGIVITASLLTLALLCHFGTTLFLMVFMPILIFGSYMTYGSSKNNRRVVSLLLIMFIAFLASFFLFYIQYTSLMKDQALSVLREAHSFGWQAQPLLLKRIVQAFKSFTYYLGIPLFATGVLSYAAYSSSRKKTIGFLLISVLLITMLIFALLSVFTPLSIRWLAPVLPCISIVCGWGTAKLVKYRAGKAVVAVLIILAVAIAFDTTMTVLFNSPYHKIF